MANAIRGIFFCFNGCKRNFLIAGLLKNETGCARIEISKKMKGKGTKQ